MSRPTFEVGREEAGMRLDQFLAGKPMGLSRSQIKRHIEEGWVQVAGAPAKPGRRLKVGELVSIEIHPPTPLKALPEEMPLDIVYEDEHLLVVNKPAGIPVHPAPGHPRGTLISGLLFHTGRLSELGGEVRPGLVHRLDKDTSGLIVVAKSDPAHQGLSSQFKAHTVHRIYHALVHDIPSPKEGVIDRPLGRDERDRKKFSPRTRRARRAVTRYKVLEEMGRFSFLEIRPETGRTHQIRVHLKEMGHPVVGDKTYAPRREGVPPLKRQALHASILGFVHPISGEYMEFKSPLPQDIMMALRRLRSEGGAATRR